MRFDQLFVPSEECRHWNVDFLQTCLFSGLVCVVSGCATTKLISLPSSEAVQPLAANVSCCLTLSTVV